ncbi:MAG: hypothetical protein EOO43_03100, partial [Flavobacterium sp.]
MANYLILINNAPKMAQYHKGLGDILELQGHQVFYAISDPIAIKNVWDSFVTKRNFIFSDFFKANEKTSDVPQQYSQINLWKTFFSDYDRNIFHYKLKSYDNVYYNNLISNLVCFFDEIIVNNKIDYLIYENISNSFSYVAYEVGKINNVEYRGYVGSRLPNRFELHTEEFGIRNRFKSAFESFDIASLDNETNTYIDAYLAKYHGNEIPSYHSKDNKLSSDYSLIKRYINKEKYQQLSTA